SDGGKGSIASMRPVWQATSPDIQSPGRPSMNQRLMVIDSLVSASDPGRDANSDQKERHGLLRTDTREPRQRRADHRPPHRGGDERRAAGYRPRAPGVPP